MSLHLPMQLYVLSHSSYTPIILPSRIIRNTIRVVLASFTWEGDMTPTISSVYVAQLVEHPSNLMCFCRPFPDCYHMRKEISQLISPLDSYELLSISHD